MAPRESLVQRVRDRVELGLAKLLLRVPKPLVERVVARRPLVVDGRTLDAEIHWATLLAAHTGRRPIESGSVERARREYRRMRVLEAEPPSLAEVRELELCGPGGVIAARVYRATLELGAPIVVYYHGGGGVIGDLDTHDVVCRRLAATTAAIVVAIDYRLAPEHAFSAATDDCIAGYRWVLAHAPELCGDATRVAVAGDSQGGKLAAVVCQLARAQGLAQPRLQVLIYPGTDLVEAWPSAQLHADGPWLTASLVEWFKHHGMGGADPSDPRVSPLRASSLAGLAPALVVVAGFDPLRDEGIAYAERLREAGVPVQLRDELSLPHGFVQMVGISAAARAAMDAISAELAAALA
ncbi:MAG: alpha/beta hydrolase [Deltaproteobacteria bacterium]|nr:alpha/beta hydrolase [Nannocystaceae bacterium]